MKTTWIEMKQVRLGDTLVIRRQTISVTEVISENETVTVIGETEEGTQLNYRGQPDEAVQKVGD